MGHMSDLPQPMVVGAQESKIAKPVAADEAARKVAADAEVRYRSIAITNYKRCLQVGGGVGGPSALQALATYRIVSCQPCSLRGHRA
jgi:hypothetical protein